jgi:hypothetical protein
VPDRKGRGSARRRKIISEKIISEKIIPEKIIRKKGNLPEKTKKQRPFWPIRPTGTLFFISLICEPHRQIPVGLTPARWRCLRNPGRIFGGDAYKRSYSYFRATLFEI